MSASSTTRPDGVAIGASVVAGVDAVVGPTVAERLGVDTGVLLGVGWVAVCRGLAVAGATDDVSVGDMVATGGTRLLQATMTRTARATAIGGPFISRAYGLPNTIRRPTRLSFRRTRSGGRVGPR